MNPAKGYNTRQRNLIEETIKASDGKHKTVEEIVEILEKSGTPVGRTTVYRNLERMVADGVLQKYTAAGECACYQYMRHEDCYEHFHLKCTECGKLIHIECERISELVGHIAAEHNFAVNNFKTVLYGVCEACDRE